jgi:hypothetical protein
VIVGLLLASPVIAQQPPSPVDIRWQAPAGCPQEGDVRDRIRKLLGSKRPDSPLRAEGTIARTDGRFHLDLVVHAGDLVGTRSIEATSCDDLAGAAAVQLGLLIHSAEAAGEPNRASEPSYTGAPTSPATGSSGSSGARSAGTAGQTRQDNTPTRSSDREQDSAKRENKPDLDREVEREEKRPSPEADTPRSWHILLQAPLLLLSVGPLPKPSLGAGLALGFEQSGWQWQLQAGSWRRQNLPATELDVYGADVDRVSANVWACRELRYDWLGFSPCLTIGGERLSVRGTGRDIQPTTQTAFGATVGAGAQARIYPATWLSLFLAASAQIELSRPEISIKGIGPVENFAPVALFVAFGLEWIL